MDMEESTKPTKSDLADVDNVQCCTCPKTPEVKDREKDDRVFFKMFENFLHNAIFSPRYTDLLTCDLGDEGGRAKRLLCGARACASPGLGPSLCAHEDTCCFTARAGPVRLWLFCCRSNNGTRGRQVLAGSNLGDKQIQERHVISESVGPGVAAHS